MNRHLGATYTLSILIVVATAVAFRGVERRPGAKLAADQPAPAARPAPSDDGPVVRQGYVGPLKTRR